MNRTGNSSRPKACLFKLISDPKGELAAKYGVAAMMGLLSRFTFIIDKNGKIKFVYSSMKDAVKPRG